eukprot:477619_1
MSYAHVYDTDTVQQYHLVTFTIKFTYCRSTHLNGIHHRHMIKRNPIIHRHSCIHRLLNLSYDMNMIYPDMVCCYHLERFLLLSFGIDVCDCFIFNHIKSVYINECVVN